MSQRKWLAAGALSLGLLLGAGSARAQEVTEKVLLDNETVKVSEMTFPPGFRGHAHPAPVNEMAYVLEGEFTLISVPDGKRLLKSGGVDWAPKGTVHSSRNDSAKPAKVLVIFFKER
ncbi:MAG: cupin domain-containing protein [candidate division NC10 bacterium]